MGLDERAADVAAVQKVRKLDIRAVGKRYRSVIAVDDVSLEVADGEFLTLLGPSGSGKTTLLSIVAGLVLPDSGEVHIDGRLATYMPAHKRDIGMVFQNYALFPHLSVFENIAFPLRMRKHREAHIRDEVARVLGIVELPHVADRLPRQLSGGQQQRIALARCMVYQPSITIMDEPLGALDKGLRDTMQLEIKRLHQQYGITVLYVTHDQEEALALSDRICLMRDGRAEQIAPPSELYFAPRSVFAASFIGDSNLLDGRVVSAAEGKLVVDGSYGRIVAEVEETGAFDIGDEVVALVRPESIRLCGSAENRENMVSGVVDSVLFAGGVMNLFVRTNDGTGFQAKLLTSRTTGAVERGARVSLSWDIRDVRLLAPEASDDK
ncbi:ABC transporter ATP-binding protein [Oceanibacterium hippocampi]|uniref:Spermidine/putrescine import ATP-binding protein PotA n=1 Tax=Oceanibacterium hippocampi TaxID=745714 RepID=A0A1Y5TW93_9PROT|nr:ABC transporter ATP-binding protein [Oceanibacterium hippocampi]SLN71832.1 Spermidine/putrescine import ATP-binding protein PotA [Oceanibacterium hippocampi]